MSLYTLNWLNEILDFIDFLSPEVHRYTKKFISCSRTESPQITSLVILIDKSFSYVRMSILNKIEMVVQEVVFLFDFLENLNTLNARSEYKYT